MVMGPDSLASSSVVVLTAYESFTLPRPPCLPPPAGRSAAMSTQASFFDLTATGPAASSESPGAPVALSKYAGKVVLVENTATL